MNVRRVALLVLALAILLLACSGCAPGTERFEATEAGFWNGLWHGFIIIVTFVIGLFVENVRMYEPNNVGALYDLGFLIGAMISLGGCASSRCKKSRVKIRKEKEWEDIGDRVEEKVKRGIQEWLAESDSQDEKWEDVGRKVEEKIKRELSKWADE